MFQSIVLSAALLAFGAASTVAPIANPPRDQARPTCSDCGDKCPCAQDGKCKCGEGCKCGDKCECKHKCACKHECKDGCKTKGKCNCH